MNAEETKLLWTKARNKQKACSFRGTQLTHENRFTQWLCAAMEGKVGELRASDDDHPVSKHKDDAKCSSALFLYGSR